eukprot:349952_1
MLIPVWVLSLVALSCIYVVCIIFTIKSSSRIYRQINEDFKDKLTIQRHIIGVVPILLYSLNQAVAISLIIHFYEINNLQFFIVSLINFIGFRIISCIAVFIKTSRSCGRSEE